VSHPIVQIATAPTRGAMPLALALVLVSLFVITSRKKAITQIIGLLMLENGVALLALVSSYGVPLIVELGVFLDALLAFLAMQVFVYDIHDTFETLDVNELTHLKH
jgi:hydrogenase-4 component E